MSQSVYKKGHCVLIDDMHFYLTGQQVVDVSSWHIRLPTNTGCSNKDDKVMFPYLGCHPIL